MASFDIHVEQAKSNLKFLLQINQSKDVYWDWHVTTCFYVAVHAVNAHLAKLANLHYRTHEDVKNALNPYTLSPCKLPESIYLDYVKLEGLSRRSRYLCSEDKGNNSSSPFITYDKHFAKAVKCLDRLLVHFNTEYSTKFGGYDISCVDLQKTPLSLFTVKK